MPLIIDPTFLMHGNFLADVSSTHSTRAQRNRIYQSRMKVHSLPDAAREFFQTNPRAYGVPRAFKIHFDEKNEDHDMARVIDQAKLTFGCFGVKGGGLVLNGRQIGPDCLDFHDATNSYTFQGQLELPLDGAVRLASISGYFNFDSATPTGCLEVNEHLFRVSLEPEPLVFNVKVSANQDAYWDSAAKKLVWNDQGDAWKKASWQSSMQFAYRTVQVHDPIEPHAVIENFFTDTSCNPPKHFDLTVDHSEDFTCVLKDIDGKRIMQTDITNPEQPPDSRAQNPVKSVFPSLFVANFEPYGGFFTGAYKDKEGNVYAMQGEVVEEDEISLLPLLASHKAKLPARDINSFLHSIPDGTPKPAFVSAAAAATPPPGLSVNALLGNDPMIPDQDDPTNYADSVARLAMRDFHDIIVYYMDEDLRRTFISAEPPTLVPQVKAIADDIKSENAKFYKSLQVPYLTAMLASSTLEEGKHCNGARAEKLLKQIPADSPVYERQSKALYRFRYLEKFPGTLQFLYDQRDKDYSAEIDRIAEVLKEKLRQNTSDLVVDDPVKQEERIRKVEAETDQLAEWANENSLYWAFRLLYHLQAVSLPSWYAQYTTGNLSSSLGMNIKKLNGLFDVLEGNRVSKDGKSFTEAFNDSIRAFLMQAIIPQMVDLDGCYSDFDSIVKESLEQFWNHFKDSKDPSLAEQAQHALELVCNDEMRKQFLDPLRDLSQLPAAAMSWNTMMDMWETTIRSASWFKVLAAGSKLFELMKYTAAGALLVLPLIPGAWSSMSVSDKVMWGLAVAGLVAVVIIKVAQGVFRVNMFWQEISGWKDTLKTIFGFESVIDQIPTAATRISSSAGRFFARTARQTAILAEEEIPLNATEVEQFSLFARMFGRNLSQLLGTVACVVLASVSLIMTSISLAKETDPLLKAVDILFILSSAIQILAFVAGWMVAAAPAMAAASVLSLVATWGGPLSLVLALVGVIILIVWMCKHKPENPVQNFVDNRVKPAGLYMDHMAIDYLEGIGASGTSASRYGVSVCRVAPGVDNNYLLLDAPDENTAAVKGTKDLDFTSNTVWALHTDGYGQSQIYTQKSYAGPATGDRFRIVWFLSVTDDQSGVCVRRLPDKRAEKDEYLKKRKFTQWTVEVIADPELDPTTKTPVSALCNLFYNTGQKTLSLFMSEKNQASLEEAADGQRSSWLLQSQSLGPLAFHYVKNPWRIYTSQKNEENRPLFEDPLAISSGYKWTIEPPLNDQFFELVTKPGADEGTIRMKEGVAPAPMSKTEYTVTCQLLVGNTVHGEQKSTIEIEVVDA